MKRFSERKGLTKVKEKIQIDSITSDLRIRIWNVLDYYYWKSNERKKFPLLKGYSRILFTRLWHNYFKEPVDTLTFKWNRDLSKVRFRFFNCDWFELYDFIEFVANEYPDEEKNEKFKNTCNEVLEEEISAYRFVGKQIVQINSKEEISEIEKSLETPFTTVSAHIETALCLMADRKTPDYRNSIKESISAVEAICQIIAKDDNATLTKALGVIEKKLALNINLKDAFRNLYYYTSSAEGIRHALGFMEQPNLNLEDARFMLISCSAFINYLITKASKAGIIEEL